MYNLLTGGLTYTFTMLDESVITGKCVGGCNSGSEIWLRIQKEDGGRVIVRESQVNYVTSVA